jgi:all-trans-retinol 13,14-reductase
MATPKYDTIVIGGGVSGLAGALLRARRGDHTVVVEKSAHLGPALRGFVRRGVRVDSGFHYAGSLGPEGLLRRLVDRLGLGATFDGVVHTPEVVDRIRFVEPAFAFDFPQGWPALEQRLGDAFPSDRSGLQHLLARMRALWEQSGTAFSQICSPQTEEENDPAPAPQDTSSIFSPLYSSSGGGVSLREAVDQCTDNPTLRALLTAHGILYGLEAHETSLLFHSQIVGSYYESACLIRGGGRVWVEALEAALRDAGVEWMCGRAVQRIDVDEQGGFAAVELEDGETVTARRCISSVHPKLTVGMVPARAFSPAYRRRIRALEETPSAVVLFGHCPSAAFTGNLILAREPSALAVWADLPPEERPLFVSSPVGTSDGGVSVICPATLADVPADGAPAPRGRPDGYEDWKTVLADRLLQRLANEAGDLVGPFELLDVATPLTFRDQLASPAGGLYGIKHRLVDLPLLPRTAVPGLYLGGQAVVAPGVLGALCSSFLRESCITP